MTVKRRVIASKNTSSSTKSIYKSIPVIYIPFYGILKHVINIKIWHKRVPACTPCNMDISMWINIGDTRDIISTTVRLTYPYPFTPSECIIVHITWLHLIDLVLRLKDSMKPLIIICVSQFIWSPVPSASSL